MTKEEFAEQYCSTLGEVEKAEFLNTHTPLPCHCNADNCVGWAMVNNDPLQVKIHNDLYTP